MERVTGRRGRVIDHALLEAAIAELSEVGYARLTLEQVAKRAGVHKTTVYRRWSSKDDLLGEAAVQLTAEEFEIPDTGDLDRDLRAAARNRVAWLTDVQGAAFVELLCSDVARTSLTQDTIAALLEQRRPMVDARLASAVAKGQLPAGVDADLFLATLVAPLYYLLLVVRSTPTAADADRAAAITLAAARAGTLGGGPTGRPATTD